MDPLVFQVVLLYIALCFCPLQGQDNKMVVPPTFLHVSKDLDLQQLLLEWDVDDEAYNSEKQMIFNIEINQTGATNIVWNENYTTTLSKSNRPIRWRWIAKEPIECMLYAVRIRSLVISKDVPVPESWSDWTKLKKVKGMDIEDSKSYIFPKDKIVEEGSDISFCCIGKKGEKISYLSFGNNRIYSTESSHRRMVFTAKNVPLSKPGGVIVICEGSVSTPAAVVFVTRPPGEPKDLSCETEDMKTLNCAWKSGSEDNLAGNRSIKFILSDMSNGKPYCNEPSKNSCSFKIGTRTTYDLKLEAKNKLGNKSAYLNFDVAQRVYPAPPFDFSVSAENSTAVVLYWTAKTKLELLCQIESRHPDGKVDLHNSTSDSTRRSHIVNGLQPYTEYAFRVHCGANLHFWKWSEWTEWVPQWTKESAPSGHLDVWRSISPGSDSFNITVFWKPFPGFRANGKIETYEIFWKALGERAVSKEVRAPDNSTVLFLDNCPCNISVSAKNSANSSSPSVIAISATSENDHTSSKEDTINNTEAGIYISWKPQSQFDGYIVDWCNHPRVQPCDFQWKKFGQSQSSALIISDAFIPGVQYSFQVYGSRGGTASLLEKKAKYLKELEPTSFPELHVRPENSRSLTLTWDYDHLNESLPGFIRGYRIFVKEKHGNCTLEELEKLVIQDGSVICKYTVEDPAKKMLTLKHPGLVKEYWLEVVAFSTSPPNITDINEETALQVKRVTTQLDRETGSWVYQLFLIPVVISAVLLICICFWRSSCVKNCCFPKVPHPTVTPFKVPQKYPKTLLAPSDFTPNSILVEEHKLQPCSCEEKDYYYNQVLWSETPAVETFTFQNIPYFIDGSNCYQSLSTQKAESQKPELVMASYKPLQCFASLSDLPNFNYVSQKDLSFPVVTQGDQAGPVDSSKQSSYKPQQALGSESSDTSEETIDIF